MQNNSRYEDSLEKFLAQTESELNAPKGNQQVAAGVGSVIKGAAKTVSNAADAASKSKKDPKKEGDSLKKMEL